MAAVTTATTRPSGATFAGGRIRGEDDVLHGDLSGVGRAKRQNGGEGKENWIDAVEAIHAFLDIQYRVRDDCATGTASRISKSVPNALSNEP